MMMYIYCVISILFILKIEKYKTYEHIIIN